MTSYKVGELPIPYRSAGASPLGANDNPITPPEPPAPVLTYFSGTSEGSEQVSDHYSFWFDYEAGQNADKLFEKHVGDKLAVTINGTKQTIAITAIDSGEEGGEAWAEIFAGVLKDDVPLVYISILGSGGVFAYDSINCYANDDAPGGIALVIADPA